MGLIVPNSVELLALQYMLSVNSVLKLYSNDITPNETSTAGSFTEVIGGGYAPKTLLTTDWTPTEGDPTFGVQPQQTFTFTGPTTGPGTIYGYYILNLAGDYIWGERFPEIFVPFIPVVGSTIKITPRFEVS